MHMISKIAFESIKIAIVLFSESFLYAKLSNRKLDADKEMMSLGLTNMLCSFLGCYPSFGSFVRNKYAILAQTNS